ncbi:PHP domain-containing protein [Halorhabdus sp. CUG00001]|uniref:PHP domain-containing protein n=1 Tax=Halorhabdus sp. CUG00001 TaxID=2600297 RepID=UPI00131E8718|nr:PHP domain-containing protein [Halorhabdus sp. CUG00001]
MKKFDLQVHTNASPCSSATPSEIATAAEKRGLDGIAITDHDTMANVEAVRDAAGTDLRVVAGVEVSTSQGHILALSVDSVPSRGEPPAVIDAIHDQHGVAVLSHPFDSFRESLGESYRSVQASIDGIETINSRCIRSAFNRQARHVAASLSLSRTGGSDAHFPFEVGRAYTLVEDDPVRDIRAGNTRVAGRGRYLSGHVVTKLLDLQRFLGLR